MTAETTVPDEPMADVFAEPAPAFSTDGLRNALREHWDLAVPDLRPLDSERDLNVRVADRFVLKISNPAERADVLDMEVHALAHARTADPGLPVPATVPTGSGASTVPLSDDTGRTCLARLITLLPGTPLEGAAVDTALAAQVGAAAGRMSVALQGFFHPAAGRDLMWDIRRMPEVFAASGLAAGPLRELADRVTPALAATSGLPAGVQHADVTLTNVLAEAGTVTAVIDFGDLHHTAAACDLATTLASVLRTAGGDGPAIDTAGGDGTATDATVWRLTEAVLRGYQQHRTLQPAEVTLLGELVIARLLTTLAVSATRRGRHRDNHRYITQYDQASERVLVLLGRLDPERLADRLQRLAGTRDLGSAIPGTELPHRRAAAMGGGLAPLFYRSPLEIVGGEGPWLQAAGGRRYLDAYNNVAVLGHAHPAVTQAVGRQLARLNTHSRYLHAGVVDLAERILATMPPELDTCLFTTSGTEANELAWRLATEFTGATGAVIAEHAYHGSSKWMCDLSSNEWPPDHRPGHVATFPAPHGRAADGSPADLSRVGAAQRVAKAAAVLRAGGEAPALVLADSQFTAEGILDVPAEFAAGLVDGAHAAGALYLADEVQSGYGRCGPLLWRFQLAGITPDIVTLGKPMGAGYPIGAVVTRREIADALARRYEYFSTFAATPAAAAAGHAVLDVVALTDLPAQAVAVGDHLRQRLRELAGDEPLLGDVRGIGLLAGVDLHPDGPADHRADHPARRALARDLLDQLVAQGVLAGTTGPRGDVLKVRPPLVWEHAHVELFVDGLRRALAALRAEGR